MEIPPEIVTKGVKITPDINKLLDRGIADLEEACDYIISTRIALEQAQGRHQTGNPYRMRVDIRIPDRADIVVKRWSKALKKIPDGLMQSETQTAAEGEPDSAQPIRRTPRRRGIRQEPVRALIRRTFDSARRELKREVEKQRGNVKTPAQQQTQALVEKIFRDQGYGFLRTLDGQQVYFHQNSLLHKHWEGLTVGTIVRFTSEMGEKGLQASTVELVNKQGAAEAHDELHELPALSSPTTAKKTRRK